MIVSKSQFDLRALREVGKQLGLDLSVEPKDGAESLRVLQGLFPEQEGILRHISLSFLLVLDPLETTEILVGVRGLIANLLIHQKGDILLLTATLDDWVINIKQGNKTYSVLKLYNTVYNILISQGYNYLFKEYYKDKSNWTDLFVLKHK